MVRDNFERQLHNVQDEVLLLGSMVEHSMLAAIQALKNRDLISARSIYESDSQINEKRFAIENAILIIIATQQPMAHDLRTLTANLEIITELERMGDYAKGIAKVVLQLGNFDLQVPIKEFTLMSEIAIDMLHRSLTAFTTEDSSEASKIPLEDDRVDKLYNQVYHFMVQQMLAKPAIIDHANLMLWVAHNLERMADRATNICERTVFIATGEFLELEIDEEDDNETD